MKTTIFVGYIAPSVDVIEIAVESGIATTGGGGINDLPTFDGPKF